MERSHELSGELGDEPADRAGRFLHEYEVAMVSCLYWLNEAPWRIGPREIRDSIFLFPVEGEIRVELSGETRVLAPGEFLMLPDGVTHTIELVEGHPRLEQIALHCDIHNAWRLPLLSQFASPFQTMRHPAYWFRVLRLLVSAINRDRDLGQRMGELVVKALLLSRITDGAALNAPRHALDPRIAGALDTIHRDYAEELTVEELANQCGLSAVQFRKLFLRHVKSRPKAYIARYRLNAGAALLRRSQRSVKQIAFDVGFRGEHYFHLAFKKAFGCTPTE